MHSLESLARIARKHGHEVRIEADRILVGIEWVNSTLGTFGIDWEPARNIQELRNVLGY